MLTEKRRPNIWRSLFKIQSIDQPNKERDVSEENQGLTVEELVAAYDFCQSQRNQAQNENAIIAGRLAGAKKKVNALTQEVEQLKAQLDGEDDGNDSSEQE